MTVWLKQGVEGDLGPEMRRAKGELVVLYKSKGLDFKITSIREGNHLANSCHYEGDALDFKRQGVPKQDVVEVLDDRFQAIEYEDNKGDIFHVEFDPR